MSPRTWLAVSIPVPPSEIGTLIPEILIALGASGVEESQGTYLAYLPPPEDPEGFKAAALARLAAVLGEQPPSVEWSWKPHEDWEEIWKRGLGPRRITQRLWVSPSWERPEIGLHETLVVLDPGMAFGTAEHPTTRGCLRLLDSLLRPGDRIADVGAGSGILSIASALLGAREVVAFEMDPESCKVAEENARTNGVDGKIRLVPGTVQGRDPLLSAPYQGILANLQRSILLTLLDSFYRSLTTDGWLVSSGLLLEEEGKFELAARRAGFTVLRVDREGEWVTMALRVGTTEEEQRAE